MVPPSLRFHIPLIGRVEDWRAGRPLDRATFRHHVVQTDIHHPTDNTLLWDVVRVVTRLIGRLAAALERRRIKGFRDRTRSARRRMQEIQRMTTRQRQDHQTATYRELIGIAEEVIESALTALRNS